MTAPSDADERDVKKRKKNTLPPLKLYIPTQACNQVPMYTYHMYQQATRDTKRLNAEYGAVEQEAMACRQELEELEERLTGLRRSTLR